MPKWTVLDVTKRYMDTGAHLKMLRSVLHWNQSKAGCFFDIGPDTYRKWEKNVIGPKNDLEWNLLYDLEALAIRQIGLECDYLAKLPKVTDMQELIAEVMRAEVNIMDQSHRIDRLVATNKQFREEVSGLKCELKEAKVTTKTKKKR